MFKKKEPKRWGGMARVVENTMGDGSTRYQAEFEIITYAGNVWGSLGTPVFELATAEQRAQEFYNSQIIKQRTVLQ